MEHYTNIQLFEKGSVEQKKPVVADFSGGDLTSDAGLLLLAEIDRKAGVSASLAEVVVDRRQPGKVQHAVTEMIRSRLGGIAMGNPDVNDLSRLRYDPAHLVFSGLAPVPGKKSRSKSDQPMRGMASQPTVSRFENAVRTKDLLRMGMALARCVVGRLPVGTKRITIDIDTTDDPCHGQQEFEGFNTYYDSHCYQPLLVHLVDQSGRRWHVASLLRPGRVAGTKGVRAVVRRVVHLLRERFSELEIILRADCGFGTNEIKTFCEGQGIHYLLGLSQNPALHERAHRVEMDTLLRYTQEKQHWELMADRPGEPGSDGEYECVAYRRFPHQAGTWPHLRCAVIKSAITQGDYNPRFVITSLPPRELSPRGKAWTSREVYWYYCQRGDQENRIKEWKIDLSSGRTSCHRFKANQFRLLLHTAAMYLFNLMQELLPRQAGLNNPQIATLRTHLLKVAAHVKVSCRRILFQLPSSYPRKQLWMNLSHNIAAMQ